MIVVCRTTRSYAVSDDRCDTQRMTANCLLHTSTCAMNLLPKLLPVVSRSLNRLNDVSGCQKIFLTLLLKKSLCEQRASLSVGLTGIAVCRPPLCSNSWLVQKQQQRFKKKGRQAESNVPSDDEEDELDARDKDDEVVAIGFKDHLVTCASLRFDVVAKSGFNIGRTKFEEALMEGRVRWNGYKPTHKKGEWVSVTDEIDLIKGRNRDNNEFLDVMRLEILDIPDIGDLSGKYKVKMRKFRKITIPDYDYDSYGGTGISED